jgi:hypothetical protein
MNNTLLNLDDSFRRRKTIPNVVQLRDVVVHSKLRHEDLLCFPRLHFSVICLREICFEAGGTVWVFPAVHDA